MDHERKCFKNPVNIYLTCEDCHQIFNLKDYHPHAAVCGGKDLTEDAEGPSLNSVGVIIPCPFCQEKLSGISFMTRTLSCAKNPENIRVACKDCDKKVKYKEHLKKCQNPLKKFIGQTEKECPICLCEIKRSLACLHKFHYQCIKDWTKKQKACPMCRANIQ